MRMVWESSGVRFIREMVSVYFDRRVSRSAAEPEEVVLSRAVEADAADSYVEEHVAFIRDLRRAVPALTRGEERLCVLIRARKRNREIARLLGIDEVHIYTTRIGNGVKYGVFGNLVKNNTLCFLWL